MRAGITIFFIAIAALADIASADFASGRSQVPIAGDLLFSEWKEFKASNGKEYADSTEDFLRFQIYINTLFAVAKHNHEYALGLQSYRQEINRFADMTSSELMISPPQQQSHDSEDFSDVINTEVQSKYSAPFSVDWREKGVVTPVKDQGKCDAGWAFASIGAVESNHAINTGKLIELSEQQPIDCYRHIDLQGCRYGDNYLALSFLREQGVNDAKSYPYVGKQGSCSFNASNIAAKYTCTDTIGRREDWVRDTVAGNGPVTAKISLTDSFFRYKDGIYFDQSCTGLLRHHVLIVGYGRDEKQGDYWIIKNSWSSAWGDKGYMKIARNKNMCRINHTVVSPDYKC